MIFWVLIIIACMSSAIIYIVRKVKVGRNRVSTKQSPSKIEYKVFIAGSTALHVERDSIRAAVSEIHNKSSVFCIIIKLVLSFGNEQLPGGMIFDENDCKRRMADHDHTLYRRQ